MKKLDTKRFRAVTEQLTHKAKVEEEFKTNGIYAVDTELSKVIKQIQKIDPDKTNYLQHNIKLKEIQAVLNKEPRKRLDHLIRIFFKYLYMNKTVRDPWPTLDKYMKYLKQTSEKYFSESSIDIEIYKGITILTLFYGFDDYYVIMSQD